MDNEEMILQMLEESHRRGRASVEEVVDLAGMLGGGWRRRANRVANALGLVVVALSAVMAVAWTPEPEYGSHVSSAEVSTPAADCAALRQMIER